MTYHPGTTVKPLKNGEYRLTTHMLWTAFSRPLFELAPFKTGGALRGEKGNATGFAVGRLPSEYWDSVKDADYVVYSYATPIAWHISYDTGSAVANPRWVMPNEKYSLTTTRHQAIIRTALGDFMNGEGE